MTSLFENSITFLSKDFKNKNISKYMSSEFLKSDILDSFALLHYLKATNRS